jgi:UDP-N-acetylmuramate--alanine ligase
LVVITNIDIEHLDIYRDENDIKDAFVEFANKVPFYGAAIVCLDDSNVRSVIPRIKRRILTYGLTPQARLRAINIQSNAMETKFLVQFDGVEMGEMLLHAPGEHNVKNALAAIGIGLELGMTFNHIKEGISRFTGVFRRFQIKSETNDIIVIDDYAHHPTEVKATLQAARKSWPERRVVAVFQPHLYSRTQQLQEEFGMSFFDADVLVVTDVYPSRETPIEGVTGNLIAQTASSFGHKNVHYVENKQDLPAHLNGICKPGDMVITMGAGDIYKYGDQFTEIINGNTK